MSKKSYLLSVIVASAVSAGVAVGTYHYLNPNKQSIPENASIEQRQQVKFVKNNALSSGVDFTAAAEECTPGVVHIKTFQDGAVQQSRTQQDFFEDFFGGQRRQPRINQGPRALGTGSGVLLTEDGYIATNNHVIKGATKIEVVLNDKRTYEATLIGNDPTTDLALLKIDEEELSFIRYGNSDEIKIGEWVLAVGNPFDLTSTVTAGIVSAKARNINILRGKENLAIESFIQTDAAVNPGNSGGALVNLKGELVGINTAIASPTGAYSGYSFAVPVTIVQKVMDDLLKYGQVQRALLGVAIQEIDAKFAEEKELEGVKGVYIANVGEGSAAKEAGMEAGDVLIKVNDNSVNSSSELQEQMARYRPGDKVNITVNRNGKEKHLKVELHNKLGTTEVVKKGEKAVVQVLGMRLQELSVDEKHSYRLRGGVKVIEVLDGQLKKEQKLREDFIILRVGQRPVSKPEEVAYIVQQSKNAVLIEGIYTNGEKAYYIAKW